MGNVVKVLFLIMVFLTPLGMLAALGFMVFARKAGAAGDETNAVLLRGQATERLLYTLASGLLGLLGYWLMSRNLIPQVEPELILIVLFGILFFIHFFIRRKLKLPKWKDWF